MGDPAKAKKVIEEAFRILGVRIRLLLSLPIEKLDRLVLQSKTREIGKTR